jgi:release factor glutamine methyltransferase
VTKPTACLPAGWRMTTSSTIGEMLAGLPSRLEKTSDTPSLDAQVLLARLLERPRSWLMAHPEIRLDPESAARLDTLVARLEGGEPLPYVLGCWEFFGLEFEVTPAVLIPRPETELLVERAIIWIKSNVERRTLKIADVGTGSGCIAISLAVNAPGLTITATDISPDALSVARRNAEANGVASHITFQEADLIPDSLSPNPFSLILANLPYISTSALHNLPVFKHEPTLALDGGADGLELIRRLLAMAPAALAPGGMILLEIEASSGVEAHRLASGFFPQARIELHQDLAGRDRLLEIQT